MSIVVSGLGVVSSLGIGVEENLTHYIQDKVVFLFVLKY